MKRRKRMNRYILAIFGRTLGVFVVIGLTQFSITQDYSCQSNSVLYVGGPVACWAGADIGAQINSAYAALPSQGGTIYVLPQTGGGCYGFSTEINFNVSGKYPSLRGLAGSNGTPSGGACLNWTPTTSGVAINLDYFPTSNPNYPPLHGLRDLMLINNLCVMSGGCGGTATGVNIGNVNWGASNATMENVSILGFNNGFINSNTNNIPGVTWINPLFQANAVAIANGGNTNNVFIAGFYVANAEVLQQMPAPGGEYTFIGSQFAVNGIPMMDFTRTATSSATLNCIACHFEDGAGAGNSHHFIQSGTSPACVDVNIQGGVMETDQSTGSSDYFVSTCGLIHIEGTKLLSGGKTITAAFTVNSPSRAYVNVKNISPATITLIGGANAAFATSLSSPGGSGNAPTAASFEAPLISQGVAQTSGNLALSSGWGTTAAVSAVAGFTQTHQFTITASGTGQAANPTITDTLPEPLANANTVCTAEMVGGTGALKLMQQTTLSRTAPVFTFGGTPGAGSTYVVAVRCGP